MPKRYVDNALNRRLGRVGMIHGTAVHSASSGSNACTYRTYVDNDLNRRLGRVGLPLGSAVHSRSSVTSSSSDFQIPSSANRPTSPSEILRETPFPRVWPSTTPDRESDSGYGSCSSRTHVDNTFNRTLGRAGLPLGDFGHSRSSVTSSSSDFQISSSANRPTAPTEILRDWRSTTPDRESDSGSSDTSSSSRSDYEIPSSAYRPTSSNEILREKPFPRVWPSTTPDRESDSGCSSRTHVDNTFNRMRGRAGLPFGTSVHSSLQTIGFEDLTASNDQHKNEKSSNRSLENGTAVKHRDDYSTKRGLEHETAVKHIVNNRSKQDLEHGTADTHKDDHSTKRSSAGGTNQFKVANSKRNVSSLTAEQNAFSLQETRLYKDNKLNRRLGRVGKPLGTHKYNPNQLVLKTYVDNSYNRRYNRVGKPIGSMPVTTKERFYKDNILNRELGRVNFPLGKCPDKPNAALMSLLHDLNDGEDVPDYISEIYELNVSNKEIIETYFIMKEREKAVRLWLEEECRTPWEANQHTLSEIIKNYRGQVINCKDLKFINVIGLGHFGDVHFAKWIKGQAVAVKVLKDKRVSQRKLGDFEREILLYCELDHANIVQILGACIELPHLAIIMEHMDISLHEALHLKDVDIPPTDRTSVMKQMAKGLSYLHRKGIVHCDLKPHNVLLNNVLGEEAFNPGLPIIAKLTDFGLSFMKYDTKSSASKTAPVKDIGTPRYSAPEVLRGASLFADDMMKADVYSLSLTILELLLEEVPFENLSLIQLKKQVGENELKPKIKNGHILQQPLKALLQRALSGDSAIRPKARYLSDVCDSFQNAYIE